MKLSQKATIFKLNHSTLSCKESWNSIIFVIDSGLKIIYIWVTFDYGLNWFWIDSGLGHSYSDLNWSRAKSGQVWVCLGLNRFRSKSSHMFGSVPGHQFIFGLQVIIGSLVSIVNWVWLSRFHFCFGFQDNFAMSRETSVKQIKPTYIVTANKVD